MKKQTVVYSQNYLSTCVIGVNFSQKIVGDSSSQICLTVGVFGAKSLGFTYDFHVELPFVFCKNK